MKKNDSFQLLYDKLHENHLAHSFLFETNNQSQCYLDILHFIKAMNCEQDFQDDCHNCNLCHLVDIDHLPSLITIKPDGANIKKEQIIALKSAFETKPIYSKYNSYIILNAEDLNSSSANTMLKFLEEPEDYIIGFFITNNKENVIDTIRSRCQIIPVIYDEDDALHIPEVWKSIALNYVKEVEMNHDEALLYNKDVLLPLIHDHKELLYLLQSVFTIYRDLYRKKIYNIDSSSFNHDLDFVLEKDTHYLIHEMDMLVQLLDEMNYNLNISLALDKYVLESR